MTNSRGGQFALLTRRLAGWLAGWRRESVETAFRNLDAAGAAPAATAV